MKLSKLTNNVVHTEELGMQVFNFGQIPLNSDASFTLEVRGDNLEDFGIQSTCGCSVSNLTKIEDSLFNVDIKYKNTHLKKPFSVIFKFNGKENGAVKKGQLKIKGNVV